MADSIEENYLRKNEFNANRRMIQICVFAAILLFVLFFGYIFKLFPLHDYTIVYITFPILIVMLLSSLLLYRHQQTLTKPRMKYLFLFSFLAVVTTINIIVPKHGILAWAIVIVLSCLYYDTKVELSVFIGTLVAMLLAIYLGALLGEYDHNLLSYGITQNEAGVYVGYEPDSPIARIELLNALLQEGENRYLAIGVYYYLPRAAIITIVFFAAQALNKRTRRLVETEIGAKEEEERVSTELSLAKSIQFSALPKGFSNIQGAEVLADLIPAKEIGGDVYEYAFVDRAHIAVFIGDVSGKGLPAAMFMMQAATCFKTLARPNRKPSEILSEMNRILFQGNDGKMFITCFLAIIDRSTGQMEFANAGHNPPIIGRNGHYIPLNCSTGFLLGVMREPIITDQRFQLQIGDILFLYTDGITEAKNEEGQFYGGKRLLQVLNKQPIKDIVRLRYTILSDVKSFIGNAPQADDITIFSIQLIGMDAVKDEITLPATEDGLKDALSFFRDLLRANRLSHLYSKVQIATDEIYSNIVKYAYEEEGGNVYLRFFHNPDEALVTFLFVDNGKAFNPLDIEEKSIEEGDKPKEGGLGIFIVKRFAANVYYDRINGSNLFLHQQTEHLGAGVEIVGDDSRGGVLAVCRAESVHHVAVGIAGQRLGKLLLALLQGLLRLVVFGSTLLHTHGLALLLGIEAQVLQEQGLAHLQGSSLLLSLGTVGSESNGNTESLLYSLADLSQ